MAQECKHKWEYLSLGGVVRVLLRSGDDIANLRYLDQKKWTVLSCPSKDLNFDKDTLAFVDEDCDGRIHVKEIIHSAEWLCSLIKDKDLILKGSHCLPLEQIDTESEEGRKLLESAKHILRSLGKGEADEISVEDSSNSATIFAGTGLNGDGIITAASTDDEVLKLVISECMAHSGSVTDRSGDAGIDSAIVEKFYAACAGYSEWRAAADADRGTIFPYGDSTPDAFAACNAIKDKVADFFMRCKLIRFNEAVSASIDISADKIGSIADKDMGGCEAEIASCPLAHPTQDAVLPFGGINPVWMAAIEKFRNLIPGMKEKESLSEEEWNGIMERLAPYSAWVASKKGAEVEELGLERVNSLLSYGSKDALLAIIAQDAALKEQSDSIDSVNKLTHLYRDFFHLLNNFVVFSDFYNRKDGLHAIFEVGSLYIDQRCCSLCLKVDGSGNHAEAAALSGMFLIYCSCKRNKDGKTMDIVAVMTKGGVKNLRPGKNAIFYDLEGNDWDAVVTKIVDNPISIKQAFFSPYVKFWDFCVSKLNKSASEKESSVIADLQSKADSGLPVSPDGTAKTDAKSPVPFDIAKFAGIFAAIGLALGYIGDMLTKLVAGATQNPLSFIVGVIGVMLCISGPSCFLAWGKLRKRNIGPVLNANGWAINSLVLVNILFGATLTSTAKYPLVKTPDPYSPKTPKWKKFLRVFIPAVIVAFGILFFTDNLNFMGIHRNKTVQEPIVSEQAAAVESDATAVTESE